MIVTIDNLDGLGALDYTDAITAKVPLRIERELNVPSVCTFSLAAGVAELAVPFRFGRVVVSDANATVLFTGYVATSPAMELVGEGTTGPVYEAVVSAVSDDVLLDMQSSSLTSVSLAESAGSMLQKLTSLTDPNRFAVNAAQSSGTVGRFIARPEDSWSKNVGLLASSARSAYKVVAGNVSLQPVGTVVHSLSETDGTLQVGRLKGAATKTLANDITVCGKEEPSAYVTEVFNADGVTSSFDLTELPYFPSSTDAQLLLDLFQGPTINPLIWQLQDSGNHFSLTAAGVTCSGGNGIDGQTTLCANNAFEMGGTILIEANGVVISAGSQGILSGLYTGSVVAASCIAGFSVLQQNGATAIAPLLNGVAVGSSFSPTAGSLYTLRTRVYSAEMQRVLQSYYSVGDSGPELWGADVVPCGIHVVLEVQDMTNGVSHPPVILYDGTVAAAPPVCLYAVIDSTNLLCSIRSVTATQQGPVWVSSIPPNVNIVTRRMGTTAQGADCRVERTGVLRFYPTSLPQLNEQVFVSYRTKRRAVARKSNAVNPTGQSSSAIPAVSKWTGTVTSPAALSSADCENAAGALLNLASSQAAAWEGSYAGWNLESQGDIWPGDVLAISATSSAISANLVVRSVEIEVAPSFPQVVKYTIHFANDWANALSIKATSTVPEDAWIPQMPQTTEPLANLLTLSIAAVSGNGIQVSAGVTAPSGGGFEVRRRDWSFGPGTDSDLVLRSPVSNFIIPREAAIEQYYVRMYDGASPPNYSRFSSAIFLNIPM